MFKTILAFIIGLGAVASAQLPPEEFNRFIVRGYPSITNYIAERMTNSLGISGGTMTGPLINQYGFIGNGSGITNINAGSITNVESWSSIFSTTSYVSTAIDSKFQSDISLNSSITISNSPSFGNPGSNAIRFIQSRYNGVLQITNILNADGMQMDQVTISGSTTTNSIIYGYNGFRSILSGTNYGIISKGGPVWYLNVDNTNFPFQVLSDAKASYDIVNYRTATNLITSLSYSISNPSNFITQTYGNTSYWKIVSIPTSNTAPGEYGYAAIGDTNMFFYNHISNKWLRVDGTMEW